MIEMFENIGPPLVVDGKETVLECVQKMAEKDVGAAAVVEDGQLRGVFTERDATRRVILAEENPATTPITEVMTTNILTMSSEADVREALNALAKTRFRHLPVCDEEGQVIAILSSRHVLRHELERLGQELDSLEAFLSADGPGG